MRQYEEIVYPKWSKINERLSSIDVVKLLRDRKETLLCDVIPLIYIGEKHFYVTESMFFSMTGVVIPSRVIHKLKSGICLYRYDFMELVMSKLNQHETMSNLQKSMITEYKRINRLCNERI